MARELTHLWRAVEHGVFYPSRRESVAESVMVNAPGTCHADEDGTLLRFLEDLPRHDLLGCLVEGAEWNDDLSWNGGMCVSFENWMFRNEINANTHICPLRQL